MRTLLPKASKADNRITRPCHGVDRQRWLRFRKIAAPYRLGDKNWQATSATLVSVGHRPSILKYHQQVLELSGDVGWTLAAVSCATAGMDQ